MQRAWIDADLLGLVLLAFGSALVLLPFGLLKDARNGWSNGSMIALITCGPLILIAFVLWERYGAQRPVIKYLLWTNKAFLGSVLMSITFTLGEQVRNTFYNDWIFIITPWSEYAWGKFTIISIAGSAFFGILAGIYQRIFHRYKLLLMIGCAIRSLTLGVSYWAVGTHATTTNLVLTQVANTMGGAFLNLGVRVAFQASVGHENLAGVVAQMSLWTKLSGGVGSTIATMIFTYTYQDHLRQEGLDEKESNVFYTSATKARQEYDISNPLRQAGIRAFTRTMQPMFLLALGLSFVNFLLGFTMPDYVLDEAHNTVDDEGKWQAYEATQSEHVSLPIHVGMEQQEGKACRSPKATRST